MKLKDSLIIILAVVIAIVVGVFVGVKITEEKNDNPIINNGTTNNNQEQNNNNNTNNNNAETERDFSLVEAEKMMSKYLYGDSCGREIYISNLYDEFRKNLVSLNNTKKQTISCLSIYGESEISLYDDSFSCMGNADFYKYTEILVNKKELFGNDSSLEKEFFGDKDTRYDYVSKMDGFADLIFNGGGDCYRPIENNIESAKIKDEELTIVISEKEFDSDSYENNEKKVIEEEKREYKFKKQNNNYYLAEINKLN